MPGWHQSIVMDVAETDRRTNLRRTKRIQMVLDHDVENASEPMSESFIGVIQLRRESE